MDIELIALVVACFSLVWAVLATLRLSQDRDRMGVTIYNMRQSIDALEREVHQRRSERYDRRPRRESDHRV